MENSPESQTSSSAKESLRKNFCTITSISKVLAAIVFITLPFLGFYLGFITQKLEVPTTADTLNPHPQPEKVVVTKRAFLGGRIPMSWSEYSVGESRWVTDNNYYTPDTVTYGVSALGFSFPPDFTQIEFRFMTKAAGDNFIKEASLQSSTPVKEELYDGVPLTVVSWPLDDGEITLNGPGGMSYLMRIPDAPNSPGYLFINKVAKGDEEFETAFASLIETMDFSYAQTHPWYSYRTMGMD